MTTRNIVVIAGGVLALGSLAGSFVFRAKATDKSDELSELRMGRPSDECSGIQTDFCSQLDSLQSDRESAASTSNVLLGVGVGLAVASVAAFFLWPKPKQESAARSAGSAGLRAVDLFVEHDRASLGFRGAFWWLDLEVRLGMLAPWRRPRRCVRGTGSRTAISC